MKHVKYSTARSALEYAALCLEQDDPGGTLPGLLRQYAEAYADLLAACEGFIEFIEYCDENALNFQLEKADDYINAMRAAIAKARGE